MNSQQLSGLCLQVLGELKKCTKAGSDPGHAAAKPKPKQKPSVVLNQFERALKDLGQMRQDWQAAAGKELSPANKERAAAVVAGLKAELAELEKVLATGG